MNRADFIIGTEFWCGGGRWRCTDIGTRTIAAIRLDQVNVASTEPEQRRTLTRAAAEAEGWFNGPPYAVCEMVFDEHDQAGCTPTQDEDRFTAMTAITRRAAQRPVFDPRPPDQIIGYNAEQSDHPPALVPNSETVQAMKAAERGEVTTAGRTGADLIAALRASPCRDIDIEPERTKAPTMPLPPEFDTELRAANASLIHVVDGPDGSEIQFWETPGGRGLLAHLKPGKGVTIYRPLISDDLARVAIAVRALLSPDRL